jgi:hypothetical protein
LLDPENESVTFTTLQRAAAALGRQAAVGIGVATTETSRQLTV